MDKIKEIDLGSFLGVEKVVDDFKTGLTDFPETIAAGALINAKKGIITALDAIMENGTLSETGFKTAIRTRLNTHYAKVVENIEGSIADDAGLTAKYKKIVASGLTKSRDTEVAGDVQEVVADGRSLITKLARYQITEPLFAEMETLANSYNGAIAEQKTAGGQANSASADMDAIFDEINDALRACDEVVKGMEDVNTAFHDAWFEARKKKQV